MEPQRVSTFVLHKCNFCQTESIDAVRIFPFPECQFPSLCCYIWKVCDSPQCFEKFQANQQLFYAKGSCELESKANLSVRRNNGSVENDWQLFSRVYRTTLGDEWKVIVGKKISDSEAVGKTVYYQELLDSQPVATNIFDG